MDIFTSRVFDKFLKISVVIDKTCALFQPHSNNQVEKFVQIVKNA